MSAIVTKYNKKKKTVNNISILLLLYLYQMFKGCMETWSYYRIQNLKVLGLESKETIAFLIFTYDLLVKLGAALERNYYIFL